MSARYVIEPIGARFSNKDLANLSQRFSHWAEQGYRSHSVFHVSQPGCMGIGQPTFTYLAVYEWVGTPGQGAG